MKITIITKGIPYIFEDVSIIIVNHTEALNVMHENADMLIYEGEDNGTTDNTETN